MKTVLKMVGLVLFLVGGVHWVSAQDRPAAAPAPAAAAKKKGYADLAPDAFDTMMKTGTNVVLDVRTREEYDKVRIPGSILLDFNSPEFEQKIAALDKDKTYLVHCASGGRSARACAKLSKFNFKSVYNLEGGITAWEKAGKKVEKSK